MNKMLRIVLLVLLVGLLTSSVLSVQAQAERVVTMGSLVELYTIDPAVGFDQAIGSSLKQLYDSLYRYVGNPPQVVPWLAESQEISDDGTVYTIHLRQDARFHDGSPLNAAAVVYSAERLLAVNQGAAGLFLGVLSPGNTVAVDDFTVQFTLDQPYGPFLDILTWLFIVNPAVVEANKGEDNAVTYLTDHEAGSGPYTQGRWQAGELYEFIAVPDYWRGWANDSYPTSVIRLVMREASTRRLAIESGDVDFVDWMSVDDINALAGTNGIIAAPGPTLTVYDVKMNTQHGPTSDPALRRAIAYAVDYDAMAAIWGGNGTLLNGPLPPSLQISDTPTYRRDLERASAELAASTFAAGTTLEYVYVTGLEDERRTGLVLQSSLAEIGLTVNITAIPWADAVASFANPETSPDLFPLYSGTAFADPDNYLWASFNSALAGNWTNPGHYANPAVDALLEQGRATADAAARSAIYAQAEALIIADSPNLFIATTPEDHIVGPRITNYAEVYCPVMGSMEDFYFFAVAG
ncbi:MAG: ABC transporter substrate-binding protein, partial [Anaerolineae bacterium]